MIPEKKIQAHYDVGSEYKFYRNIKAIPALEATEILIVDPYFNQEMFSLYADGIDRSI